MRIVLSGSFSGACPAPGSAADVDPRLRRARRTAAPRCALRDQRARPARRIEAARPATRATWHLRAAAGREVRIEAAAGRGDQFDRDRAPARCLRARRSRRSRRRCACAGPDCCAPSCCRTRPSGRSRPRTGAAGSSAHRRTAAPPAPSRRPCRRARSGCRWPAPGTAAPPSAAPASGYSRPKRDEDHHREQAPAAQQAAAGRRADAVVTAHESWRLCSGSDGDREQQVDQLDRDERQQHAADAVDQHVPAQQRLGAARA